MNKKKVKNVLTWVLQVLMGLEFILVGQAKFTNMRSWEAQFERWGYPDHVYLLVGGLELVGAIFVLIPKTASRAALGLGVIMIGATLTHVVHQQWDRVLVTLILAAFLGLLYWLRKEKG